MSNKPSVSVVVPFYNAEAFIPGLMDCFSRQTMTDFEMIAVNDGSRDGTSQLLHSYEGGKLPFSLTVIDKENGGVAGARNTGIAHATGKYVCFCDCDDAVSPRYLSALRDALETSGCGIALSYIANTEDALDTDPVPHKVYAKADFLREFLYHGILYHHCAGMYRRELLTDDFVYPDGYRYSEDVFFLWKLAATADTVAVIESRLYCYFKTGGSAMSKMTPARTDAVKLMQMLEPFMDEHAPDFAPLFRKYVVARHIWSILWQATAAVDSYAAFLTCVSWFENVDARMAMLADFPDKKVRLTAGLYRFSKRLYYTLMRLYVKGFKR